MCFTKKDNNFTTNMGMIIWFEVPWLQNSGLLIYSKCNKCLAKIVSLTWMNWQKVEFEYG